jgi:hypothetical protein
MLIDGSADKTAEANVQTSESRMIRSNRDLRRPVFLFATLLKTHPMTAIVIPMELAATECGANATYNNRPSMMSLWPSCAKELELGSDPAKCIVNEISS